eukprot:PhF_6_TR39591/c0_g1_i1/m.58672
MQRSFFRLYGPSQTRGSRIGNRQLSNRKTPYHEPQKFGGRIAHVKQYVTVKHGSGTLWKKDPKMRERVLAVFEAQQFSRREWKSRDYDVYELPYEFAPKEMQRVIPDLYTEIPIRANDGTNLRQKVYDRETMASVLYGAPCE